MSSASPVKSTNHEVRLQLCREIYSTEVSYVNNLRVLQDLYIFPLLQRQGTSHEILNGAQLSTLFSSVQVIISLNGKFLDDVKKRVENWKSTTTIGDLFVKFAPFFKMYTEFVNNHDNSLILLGKLMREKTQKAKKFQTFSKNCERHPRSQGLGLHSFLILPIQRIPRYELFMEKLWLNTGVNHYDHKPLTEALKLVRTTATHINEAVRLSENRQRITLIQQKFSGDHHFVAPHRIFIRQGELLRKTRTSTKTFSFFLFNDLLIYASEKFGRYRLHQLIPVDKTFGVVDVAPSAAKAPQEQHAWQIVSAVKSFILYAKNAEEKIAWVTDLKKCVDELHRMIKPRDYEHAAPLKAEPVLQSASEASACMCCHRPFTFLVRRHHCRGCGHLVCADCSRSRMVLKNTLYGKPQRVCQQCVDKHTRETRQGIQEDIEQTSSVYTRLIDDFNEQQGGPRNQVQPQHHEEEDMMLSPEMFDLEHWVWLPHDQWGFVPAKLVETRDNQHIFQTIYNETVCASSSAALEHLPQATASAFFDDLEDLIHLEDFSEGSILQQLRLRYQKDKIYTNIGGVLVAINPFQLLPIYTSEVMSRYKSRSIGDGDGTVDGEELAPHVYEVAAEAYRGLISEKRNQSVIISGESGSGKTETTKLILLYLSEIGGSDRGVEQDILNSSPILEAFGNAKTVQNDNSSRFGKYVEIHFSRENRVCGADIKNYLLEKARVVQQHPSERNFHIFYQLCAAADEYYSNPQSFDTEASLLFDHLQLGVSSDFHYLSQSGCHTIEGVQDAEDFGETIAALKYLKFSLEEISHMVQTLAVILHVGNLRLTEDCDEGSKIENIDQLELVNALSGLDQEQLEEAICYHSITVVKETHLKPLTPDKAAAFRDALAKHLYNRLFDWLVVRVNYSLKDDESEAMDSRCSSIGVLDIYGFEVFETNSLEQFFINYANEVLQEHFNYHIFKSLQEEYLSDGIEQSKIQFVDNKDCISLIESRQPAGVLKMLDEELKMAHCSDETFAGRMHSTFHEDRLTRHRCYDRLLKFPLLFIVKHYAGHVTYNVTGFVEKNRDKLQPAFETLLKKGNFFMKVINDPEGLGNGRPVEYDVEHDSPKPSTSSSPSSSNLSSLLSPSFSQGSRSNDSTDSPLTAHSFSSQQSQSRNPVLNRIQAHTQQRLFGRSATSGGSRALPFSFGSRLNSAREREQQLDTLSTKFCGQLTSLMDTLKKTRPSFIRCIKPNDYKMAQHFDSNLVLRQMRNGGLFETIRIRREGYPRQAPHIEFVKRFECILNFAETRPPECVEAAAMIADKEEYTSRELCDAVVNALTRLNLIFETDLIIGKTRVFWRIAQDRLLESQRRAAMNFAAKTIQDGYRTVMLRRQYLACKDVAHECRTAVLSRNVTMLDMALVAIERSQMDTALLNGYITEIERVQDELKEEAAIIQKCEEALTTFQTPTLEEAIRKIDRLYPEGQPQFSGESIDQVICMFDYDSQAPDELSFKTNDIIDVIDRPIGDQWWVGKLRNAEGTFPSNYTEQMPPTPDSLGRVAHPQTARLWSLYEKCQEYLQQKQAAAQARRVTEEGVDLTKEKVDDLSLDEINVDELMKAFAPSDKANSGSSNTDTDDVDNVTKQLENTHVTKQLEDTHVSSSTSPMSDTSASDEAGAASMKDTNSNSNSNSARSSEAAGGSSSLRRNSSSSRRNSSSRDERVQLQGDSTISPTPTLSVSSTGSDQTAQSNLKSLSMSVSHSHSNSTSLSSSQTQAKDNTRKLSADPSVSKSSSSSKSESPAPANSSPDASSDDPTPADTIPAAPSPAADGDSPSQSAPSESPAPTPPPTIPRSKPKRSKPARPAPLSSSARSSVDSASSSSSAPRKPSSAAATPVVLSRDNAPPQDSPLPPKAPPPSVSKGTTTPTEQKASDSVVKPHPPTQPPPKPANPVPNGAPPSPRNAKASNKKSKKHARVPSDMTSGGLPKSLARRYGVFVKHCEPAMLEDFVELRGDSDYLKGLFLHPKKRETLRSKRYCFQKIVIPRSLCAFSQKFCGSDEIRSHMKQVATESFNNILGYMRTKYHAYPETNGHAVVRTGFREPLMRDELFAQLVKQTTDAPPSDKLLGWKLIFLCLNSFMPSLVHSYENSNAGARGKQLGGGPFQKVLLYHISQHCHPDASWVSEHYNDLGFSSVADVATHCYFQYMSNLERLAEGRLRLLDPSLAEIRAITNGKIGRGVRKDGISASPSAPANASGRRHRRGFGTATGSPLDQTTTKLATTANSSSATAGANSSRSGASGKSSRQAASAPSSNSSRSQSSRHGHNAPRHSLTSGKKVSRLKTLASFTRKSRASPMSGYSSHSGSSSAVAALVPSASVPVSPAVGFCGECGSKRGKPNAKFCQDCGNRF